MVFVLAQGMGTDLDWFEVSQNQGGKEPRDLERRSPHQRWDFRSGEGRASRQRPRKNKKKRFKNLISLVDLLWSISAHHPFLWDPVPYVAPVMDSPKELMISLPESWSANRRKRTEKLCREKQKLEAMWLLRDEIICLSSLMTSVPLNPLCTLPWILCICSIIWSSLAL